MKVLLKIILAIVIILISLIALLVQATPDATSMEKLISWAIFGVIGIAISEFFSGKK
ncbi:MAG: hypothetical protein ACRCXK_10790 [Wohlfahrtiimonas sp.]